MNSGNTFENGMHQDFDFLNQPKGTYRSALNGEIFGVSGGNFAWKPINGTEKVNLPIGYKPIGGVNVQDGLVLILVQTTTGVVLIIKIDKNNSLSFLYASDSMSLSVSNLIKGYSYYEDEETEFIYFNDRVEKPKCINTRNITVYTEISTLQQGKIYAVLSGLVIYEGNIYGTGSHFTLFNYTAIQFSGEVNLIDYYESDVLDWNPLMTNEEIITATPSTGALEPGIYYISFRYITFQNHHTPWSPLSQSYGILNTNGGLSYEMENYGFIKDWIQYQGGDIKSDSELGFNINIENIPISRYKFIEIAAFRSVVEDVIDTGVIFSKIELDNTVYDLNNPFLSIDTILYNYTGVEITQDGFLIQPISIESIQDLESINQRNIIINMSEEQDINMGQKWSPRPSSDDIKTCIDEVPIDVMPEVIESESNSPVFGIYGFDEDGYVKKGHLLKNQFYKVYDNPIVHNIVSVYPGEVFRATSNPSWAGYGKIKPVKRICEYGYGSTNVFKYLDVGHSAFPKGFNAKYSGGYWGNETYRLGILPKSLTGKDLSVRWFDDYKVPVRNSSSSVFEFDDNGVLIASSNAMITEHTRDLVAGYEIKDQLTQLTARYDSLLVNVDLSDIIDDISGFSIVRAKRDKGVLSEGFIDYIHDLEYTTHSSWISKDDPDITIQEYTRYPSFNDKVKHYPLPFGYAINDVHVKNNGINEKSFIYISPDLLFASTKDILDSDQFALNRVYDKVNGDVYTIILNNDEFPEQNVELSYRILKLSNIATLESDDLEPTGINQWKEINIGDTNIVLYDDSKMFHNFCPNIMCTVVNEDRHAFNRIANGAGSGILINIKKSKKWFDVDRFSTYNQVTSPEKIYIIEQKRGSSDYGSQGDASLKDTEYILTGHYQPITDEFKANIKDGDTYIAKNIQIFGGDCYINLFEHERILMNGNIVSLSSNAAYGSEMRYQRFADMIIVPLQSRINNSIRNGRFPNNINHGIESSRIAYNSLYKYEGPEIDEMLLTNDIYQSGLVSLYEEYKCNGAFRESITDFTYPPLSPFSSLMTRFTNRFRWSLKKSIGNIIDSFTNFPPLQFLDIPGINGELINIKTKGSRLFYWQTKGIGFLPVNERALTANSVGLPIQLGIGGEFERDDEIYKTYGNQDLFSLIETDNNWIWFDYERKTLLSMEFSGKLTEESIIKGLDSFFQNELPSRDDIEIVSGFDEKTKITYLTFLSNSFEDEHKTISINSKINKIIGFNSIPTYMYLKLANDMFTFDKDSFEMFRHNIKSSNLIHDNSFESNIEIIIGNENVELKKFMNIIFKAGNQFFDSAEYSTQYQDSTEHFLNTVSESVGTEYDHLIDEWTVGVPEGNNGRMIGLFMKLKLILTDQSKFIRLSNIITNYLKQY